MEQSSDHLLLSAMTVGGEHVLTTAMMDITDPATGRVFHRVPKAEPAHLDAAVAAAHAAFPTWARLGWDRRAELLAEVGARIEANADRLARLLTLEQGKPLNNFGSVPEVASTGFVIAELAALRPEQSAVGNSVMTFMPLGVVGCIVPWNFPLGIALAQLVPALLAGNTVIVKPSPGTPVATLEMVAAVADLLPSGVLNALSGDDRLGGWMTTHPGIDKIAFTGSTETGKAVMRACAGTLKRLTLELGGNDAAILLEDVVPEVVAEKLFWSAFINNGQTCAAVKRIYAPQAMVARLGEALAEVAARVPIGPGIDASSQLGPLQNARQRDRVAALVDEARARGARVHCGGARLNSDGFFYPATILSGCDNEVGLVQEEQFGPAVPIVGYESEEAALSMANASSFGLGGSVWSSDTQRAASLARQLETGTIWVNEHALIHPQVPFFGTKQSGFGAISGRAGIEGFCRPQIEFSRSC